MQPGVTLDDVVVPTGVQGMDLLPSNIDLSAAEVQLVHEVAREQTLQRVLAPAIDHYDVILIDCQPSLGLLTVNALTASDGVIVPAGVRVLRPARRRAAQDHHRQGPRAAQPAPGDRRACSARCSTAARCTAARSWSAWSRRWGDKVFHTVIRRTVKFSDSTVAGEPITEYATTSAGADAYRQLAKEVALRCLDA